MPYSEVRLVTVRGGTPLLMCRPPTGGIPLVTVEMHYPVYYLYRVTPDMETTATVLGEITADAGSEKIDRYCRERGYELDPLARAALLGADILSGRRT